MNITMILNIAAGILLAGAVSNIVGFTLALLRA
jgi:hypothetical protein